MLTTSLQFMKAIRFATVAVMISAPLGMSAADKGQQSEAAIQAPDERGRDGRLWVAAWQGSPTVGGSFDASYCPSDMDLKNQTVRNIVFASTGGDRVRVRISNVGGASPLRVGSATIALSAGGSAIVDGTTRNLLFGGSRSTLIAAEGEGLSDPVSLDVSALQTLAISIYLPDRTGPATQHYFATENNFLASGNQVEDMGGRAFARSMQCWLFLSGVDVRASRNVRGALVTLGDSITDGYQSTTDGNQRYPDQLARRFAARNGPTLSVSNAGLGGNELLNNQTGDNALIFGVPASARLPRDVLAQAGARAVILLEGINDIGASYSLATDLIQAEKQIITQVRAAGLRIYGGTLIPFGGSQATNGVNYGTPFGEEQREALNHWIRTAGAFDGVIDFDKAVRDPQNPTRMRPAYDSGDHLHPNDAGYLAMADAVNLEKIIRESLQLPNGDWVE